MGATALFIAVVLGWQAPEQSVTAQEKEKFLELLRALPHKGEFFTAEAIVKAAPYTRVLLALTEKDVGERDIYPFLALSRGLVDREGSRKYGAAHFETIAHPLIKMAWAAMLFDACHPPPPDVVVYLKKALESTKQTRVLSEITGPDFPAFKKRVLQASRQK